MKWYAYAKWVLERVESFPKSQRFILGQRLSNHVMDVLESLVKASYVQRLVRLKESGTVAEIGASVRSWIGHVSM